MTYDASASKRSDNIPAMFSLLRHVAGWIISSLGSRTDLILENLALRQQLLALHTKRPRHRLSSMHKLFWVLLRRLWSGWKAPLMNCRGVASGRLSPILEMDLQSQSGRWPNTRKPGDSDADLSHGGGEPDVGRTPDPWRVAKAGLRYI